MFYRKAFMGAFLHTAGAAVGSVLAGIVSFNNPRFMFGGRDLSIAPKSPPKKRKSRGVNTHRGWREFAYEVNTDPNSREAQRRQRQGAHHLQRLSHKPGTVQPRHIFATEA